jgi:hypothetical protein
VLLDPETGILVAAGVVSAAGAFVLARIIRDREVEPEDVTIGFLGPSLAAIYLLVLALALATEWQTIGTAQSAVSNEAVAIRQLYLSASGLPTAAANNLRAQVRDYATTVVNHDWPEMERGTLDERSDQLLTTMSTYVIKLNVQTASAATAQQYAIGEISILATSRAGRASAAGTRLPLGVIIAVIATSLIVCLFPFAGGLRTSRMSVTIAVLQVALVTIGVVVVFQLNNPFTGPLATGPGQISTVATQIGAQ